MSIILVCLLLLFISVSSAESDHSLPTETEQARTEQIVYSERCIKIKQAEQAIQEQYQIVPEMYTFFSRRITETDNGTVSVILTGADQLYWVLGTYTGSSDGKTATTAWSNEGKQTYGGFDAPAWEALQLHQMIDIARKEHAVTSFFPKAVFIASRDDPNYSETDEEGESSLLDEHQFELTAPHPDHQTIEKQSVYSREELNNIAIAVISETYSLSSDQTAKVCMIDSEPDFLYEIKNGQLLYHARLQLQQSTELDEAGYMKSTEHDGEYLVVINAETGVIEDVVYDSSLNGNG